MGDRPIHRPILGVCHTLAEIGSGSAAGQRCDVAAGVGMAEQCSYTAGQNIGLGFNRPLVWGLTGRYSDLESRDRWDNWNDFVKPICEIVSRPTIM